MDPIICGYYKFGTCNPVSMDWDNIHTTEDPGKTVQTTTMRQYAIQQPREKKKNWMDVSSKPEFLPGTIHHREEDSSWKPPIPIPRDSLIVMMDEECQSDTFTDEIQWDPIISHL